jgi:hypothetical protein
LSNELNTKLQRHTISAQASGPCNELKDYTHILEWIRKQQKIVFHTSANEKQTMNSFSSFG